MQEYPKLVENSQVSMLDSCPWGEKVDIMVACSNILTPVDNPHDGYSIIEL
jgi:hypothetical protein